MEQLAILLTDERVDKIMSGPEETAHIELAKLIGRELCGFDETDEKYIDLFWDIAFNENWMYVTEEMVHHQMGCPESDLMMRNFYATKMKKLCIENIEYQQVTKDHPLVRVSRYNYNGNNTPPFAQTDARGGSNRKHYIISGEAFKKLLMSMNNARGKEVCGHYCRVEMLCKMTHELIKSVRRYRESLPQAAAPLPQSLPLEQEETKESSGSRRSLSWDGIVIQSRASDNYVNATQLCQAGGKKLSHWYSLDTTKRLIETLKNDIATNAGTSALDIEVVDKKVGGNHQGTWIHPDLAVQLAQWVSPAFGIQVSRWVRELFITGFVSIDSKKTDAELNLLQKQLLLSKQREQQLIMEAEQERQRLLVKQEETEAKLEAERQAHEKLRRRATYLESGTITYAQLGKTQRFYLATTVNYARANRFEFGGVKVAKELRPRLSGYNTGRAEGDLLYYTKLFPCNDYKTIESRIHSIMQNYKDKQGARKEMVIMRYDRLCKIIEFLCANSDREVDYINDHCKEILDEIVDLEPIIPEPLILEDHIAVTVSRAGKKKTNIINIETMSEAEVDALLERIINTCAAAKVLEYKFAEHRHSKKLELAWDDVKPVMKEYGISPRPARSLLKEWFGRIRPMLKIGGVLL